MRIDKVTRQAFFTINIKLRKVANNRDATPEEYINLIKKVHRRKIHKASSNGKHCIIKYLMDNKDEHGKINFLYGRVAQFSYFENKSWFDIQRLDLDEDFTIPEGLFPDTVEADFIFDPYSHKFSVLTKSNISISPYPLRFFWEEALNDVIEEGEFIHVDVVTGKDFFEKLNKSRQIRRLEIDINYSNSGIGTLSKEIIDDDLKKSNAKNATLLVVAKTNESIDVESSNILKGALELSEEDGDAKAKIIDDSGNLIEISTRRFVKKSFFQSNTIHLLDNFIDKMRQIWPPKNN